MTTRTAVVTCIIALMCPVVGSAQTTQLGGPALSRTDFNRLACQANQPLFWVVDKNKNKVLDAGELAVTGAGNTLAKYESRGKLSRRFVKAYRALRELRRREAVARELDGGRPTLVRSDLTGMSSAEKKVLKQLLAAGKIIEELYLHQTGAFKLKRGLAKAGAASKTLFWRNHGPWCHTPGTAKDPFCNALPGFPKRFSEAYPADAPQDDAMCKSLQKHAKAKELLNPFTVVKRVKGELTAVPLNKVYGKQMKAVAKKLRAAAKVVARDAGEKAFQTYLLEAAKGFETNKWERADEAWAAMNAKNSKWYLRIAPDEVYFDPCQQKAGFHMALARIDQGSLEWQKKLTPLRKKMEGGLAKLIGAAYKARNVRFHMPDFIKVVQNNGDSRHPLGVIIGQSLPNWGKVAREGRGRTVVMTHLYTDPDSMRIMRLKARALLSKASLAHYTADQRPFLINIILHEASHNFGPHSDFRVKGKVPKVIFGGKLASIMEELKAQTAALWYLQFLRKHKLIDDKTLKQAYTQAILWCFGHIAQGMFTPGGNVKSYSQLAAVQIGYFIEQGALTYKRGRFTINFKKLPGAVDKLTKKVGLIKATGNRTAARKLIDRYVKGKSSKLVRMKRIRKVVLKYPKATFLYSVAY